MPLFKVSSKEALNAYRRLAETRWPNTGVDKERLTPVAQPTFKPSFQLTSGEKIFTTGSCFARNIERRLLELGFDIPAHEWLTWRGQNDTDAPGEFLNKYIINAIEQEFTWALDPDRPFPGQSALMHVGEDKWYDPFSTTTVAPTTLERVEKRRAKVMDITATVKECRVVIITLGLTEAWYDRELGLYLNSAPPRTVMRSDGERYEMHALSYDDVLQSLNRIHALITRFGRPDVRFLVTVSPVPLVMTFTDADVLQANAYSKSVQRAAVEEFWRCHDNVDYFPSFESITLSDRSAAFEADFRHVTPAAVGVNISSMAAHYMPDETRAWAHLSEALAKVHEKCGDVEAAKEHRREALSLNPDHPEAKKERAIEAQRNGRHDEAIKDFRALLADDGASLRGLNFHLGVSLAQVKDYAGAAQAFTAAAAENEKWAPPLLHKARALKASGDLASAAEAARGALERDPKLEAARTLLEELEPSTQKASIFGLW